MSSHSWKGWASRISSCSFPRSLSGLRSAIRGVMAKPTSRRRKLSGGGRRLGNFVAGARSSAPRDGLARTSAGPGNGYSLSSSNRRSCHGTPGANPPIPDWAIIERVCPKVLQPIVLDDGVDPGLGSVVFGPGIVHGAQRTAELLGLPLLSFDEFLLPFEGEDLFLGFLDLRVQVFSAECFVLGQVQKPVLTAGAIGCRENVRAKRVRRSRIFAGISAFFAARKRATHRLSTGSAMAQSAGCSRCGFCGTDRC